jgi:hypothetical protein
MKKAGGDTVMVVLYKQGREGQGKPSDIFAVRVVVPDGEESDNTLNPYRFGNFERLDESVQNPDAYGFNRGQRMHRNMTSATVESIDYDDIAMDDEGHAWGKVYRWKQESGNMSDESFANPYSDSKGHRGFIRGKMVVIGYSLTPNWGRRGGDHMDFYVRRSFNGGKTWTTNPKGAGATHEWLERDKVTGEYQKRYKHYGPGEFEPGRNVSILKGNSHTVTDPRLVPTMGTYVVNDTPLGYEDDTANPKTFYVAFGTAKVLRAMGEPLGAEEQIAEDIFYTRTTDGGATWLMVPWVINPDSQGGENPAAGETVYRWPWLAQGAPHQGHAQLRAHPSGTRMYAIWHQWAEDEDTYVSPHDIGDDIWFRRIDFPTEVADQ